MQAPRRGRVSFGTNGSGFDTGLWADALRALPNPIFTAHIGGSTEARQMIGEVFGSILRYLLFGISVGAANFPEVDLRAITAVQHKFTCTCYTQSNIVPRRVNEILSDHNVEKQCSDSKGGVAYLMADVVDVSEDVQAIYVRINQTTANIITRHCRKALVLGREHPPSPLPLFIYSLGLHTHYSYLSAVYTQYLPTYPMFLLLVLSFLILFSRPARRPHVATQLTAFGDHRQQALCIPS